MGPRCFDFQGATVWKCPGNCHRLQDNCWSREPQRFWKSWEPQPCRCCWAAIELRNSRFGAPPGTALEPNQPQPQRTLRGDHFIDNAFRNTTGVPVDLWGRWNPNTSAQRAPQLGFQLGVSSSRKCSQCRRHTVSAPTIAQGLKLLFCRLAGGLWELGFACRSQAQTPTSQPGTTTPRRQHRFPSAQQS